MKTKVVFLLLTTTLLIGLGWLVRAPNPGQAQEVPEKYRDMVQKGLDYLARAQHKDGHWEGDDGKHPVAMTGLVGLALLMEKRISNTPSRPHTGAYSANIRKAVDWLLEQSRAEREGLLYSGHASETARYMQGHGLATLFLAGAYSRETEVARQKKHIEALERAVKYIVQAQSNQGGWYDTSKVEGHDFDTIAATVIQIQALQAADKIGIPFPRGRISDAQAYLKAALDKYEEKAKPENRARLVDTTAALAEFSRPGFSGLSRTAKLDEGLAKWFKFCDAELPKIKFGRDELVHYYYAQAVFNVRHDAWSAHSKVVFDQLQSHQNKDGSWPSAEGISIGPVYATASWCVILQLDNNSHPSRPIETAVD